MEANSPFRRKKQKKVQIENLYKVLGTRSNIGQDKLKGKYIEKLRKTPPETHPEEFEALRRAYETLKDPQKRRQYDLMRKYGDKIDGIMEEAGRLLYANNFEKAEELLKKAAEIEPENIVVKLRLAEVALEQKDFAKHKSIIDEVLEKCTPEEKEDIIFFRCVQLGSRGYFEKALEALEQGKEFISNNNKRYYYRLRIQIFIELQDTNRAWHEFVYALPPKEERSIDDIDLLIQWLNVAIDLNKWGDIPKIQSYIKRIANDIQDEEDIFILKEELAEEAELYADNGYYRRADVFIQVASQIDSNDSKIRERKREIQNLIKLDMELTRFATDNEVFGYVHVMVEKLYFYRYSSDECYANFMNEFPYEMMKEMEGMKEEIAYGVLRLKKKYPSLYKEFNKELMDLFNQCTEGFNREQKRRLR